MEAIGAIASVLQLAQTGAKLSISLYTLADAIGSANKDVQHVAKDIALFSSVLKDLGNTLNRGRQSKLYREGSYDTSQVIVKECQTVFAEIEDVVKLSEGEAEGLVTLSRMKRVQWVFRKSRVQLLRGNLESLKSTISLQLAVLHYASTISSSLVHYYQFYNKRNA